jgi:hypothetical protein
MKILRIALKYFVFLIYAAFVVAVLYFPAFEMLYYIGRETRSFRLPSMMPVEDVLLPCFLLALLYGTVSFILRKIESPEAPGNNLQGSPDD